MVRAIGRDRLVLDLSCRRRGDAYYVVTDRWQTFTDVAVMPTTLGALAEDCAEFLVHGADVEGRLPIAESDRQDLKYVVDFWFCYLVYAGFSPRLAAFPLAILLALTFWAGIRLRSSALGRW